MTLYIDENLPPQLARSLDIIQQALNAKQGTNHRVIAIKDEFGEGAKDEDWIPKIKGNIVITQDYRIQTTRHQRDLYEEHGVGIFFFKAPSKTGWDFMQITIQLITKWEKLLQIVNKKKPPYGYRTTAKTPQFDPIEK